MGLRGVPQRIEIMSGLILLSESQGWLKTVFGAVWTYLFLGFFFAALLIGMLFSSLRTSVFSRSKPCKKQPSASLDSSISSETHLLDALQTAGKPPLTVLLGAAGLDCLPLTVPIRLAMLFTRKHRCLLIDLDTRRDAVWKAFGNTSPTTFSSLPTPSGFENLFIIPAHYFEQSRQMNLGPILRSAEKQFDYIFINTPYLDGHPDRNLIVSFAEYAFLFARNEPQFHRLTALCRRQKCKILGCYKPPAPASLENSPSKDAAAESTTQTVRCSTGQS